VLRTQISGARTVFNFFTPLDVTSKTSVLHQQETLNSGNTIYFKSDRKIICFNVQREIYVTENVTEY